MATSNYDACMSEPREIVRAKLRLFDAYRRAKLLKDKKLEEDLKKRLDRYKPYEKMFGRVPGVEIGDEFRYFSEMNLIGLHHRNRNGIAYVEKGKVEFASCIVASNKEYGDEFDSSEKLSYRGEGGNLMNPKKPAIDQSCDKKGKGNMALIRSRYAEDPVRVVRGEPASFGGKKYTKYTYYGLYKVIGFVKEEGPRGKMVYKFELERCQGQLEAPQKLVKSFRKSGMREGVCVKDISLGKELFPVSAVNLIDNEKPPTFEYITRILYPDWRASRTEGCHCTSVCSSGNCDCIVMNGGEIPYNCDVAVVRTKALVYECGPSCKCPPSCNNRVSQQGIKFQLEIFKTGSRGWGVRSLDSIPSGSFVCEYVGELLTNEEAEKRSLYNDDYLFGIRSNYMDSTLLNGLSTLVPDNQSSSSAQDVQDTGFTLDAAGYGNVGRFINHSCSPNLYAQNVLYDHLDKRVPHVMLFAAESIHPLQELTYHYHCQIDSVYDADGNIRKKPCYCGSSVCPGRIY